MKRSKFITSRAGWGWVVGDPVVGWMAPALYLLARRGRVNVDEETLKELGQTHRWVAARQVRQDTLLARVAQALEGEGVSVIPLKGAALRQRLYGDDAVRSMVDADLLVRPEEFCQAVRVLRECGYSFTWQGVKNNLGWFEENPATLWPVEVGFGSEEGQLIDLHIALLAPWYLKAFPVEMEGTWQRSRIEAGGQKQNDGKSPAWKRTLADGDTLAYLCLNQAMEGMGSLKNLLDIDLLMRTAGEGWNWEGFLSLVNEWKIRSAAYHTFLFCREFMQTPFPEGLLERLDPGWAGRARVRLLVTPGAVLANRQTAERKTSSLVKLALIDRFADLMKTGRGLLFPKKDFYIQNPRKKGFTENWVEIARMMGRKQ